MDINYGNIEHTCHLWAENECSTVLWKSSSGALFTAQAWNMASPSSCKYGSYTILERPEFLKRLEIGKGLAEDLEHKQDLSLLCDFRVMRGSTLWNILNSLENPLQFRITGQDSIVKSRKCARSSLKFLIFKTKHTSFNDVRKLNIYHN